MIDSNHLVSLLEEDDVELQITGLELINANIEHIWHEVSESILLIDSLTEVDPARLDSGASLDDLKALSSLASIVLSKLYFHLGKLDEALKHALHSGTHFTTSADDEFTSTLLHFCVDKYIELRTRHESKKSYFKTTLRLSTSSLGASTVSSSSALLEGDDDDDDDDDVTITSSSLSEKSHAFSDLKSDSKKREEKGKCSLSDSSTLICDESYDDEDGDDADADMPLYEMEAIVANIIRDSLNDGDEAVLLSIGLSIDCRRDDLLSELLEQGGRSALEYCRRLVMDERLRMPLEFRVRVTKLLEKHYRASAAGGNKEDYFVLVRCLVALAKPRDVAELLITLTDAGRVEDELIALQIAFDLASEQPQKFLHKVLETVKGHIAPIAKAAPEHEPTKDTNEASNRNSNQISNQNTKENTKEDTKEDTAAAAASAAVADRYKKLLSALSGNAAVDLELDFLYNANHSDMYLISYIKMIVESQANVGKKTGNIEVTRNATLAANALMHAGTAVDVFVRKNIDWVAEATYWSTFSATAGLGAIHRGHHKHAFKLLGVYLPSGGAGAAGKKVQQYYSEGGALYALGLIHAGNGAAAIDYLKEALASATSPAAAGGGGNGGEPKEMVVHGACLGLGLAGLGTADRSITEQLWDVVVQPEGSIAQEAAALAIGLVNIGASLQEDAENMLTFARENPHDRVVRAISVALALAGYGRQEAADAAIEALVSDKNPEIRFGGMYAVGLAYCGTCAECAISRLLTAAVSDVSDDVRRAALTALGFVLHKSPQSCPHLVALLTDSFNPHVRYGAAMALGISCAGTALPEAIALLEPMMNDPSDIVRQGAMIAMAMVLIQATTKEVPRLEKITRKILDRITDARDEVMSKMGAILAMGIVNAGGRNVTIARDGFKAAAGLTAFSLYWYWTPVVHFLTLAFAPTAVITLDQSLEKVSLKLRSDAPPSMFAYPENMKAADTVSDAKDTPASVLAYGKNRLDVSKQMELEKQQQKEKMEVEEEEQEKKKKKKKMEDEAKFEIIETPCRVTPRQRKVVKFEPSERYVPVKKSDFYGIVIVNDLEKEAEVEMEEGGEEEIVIGGKKEEENDGNGGLKDRPEGTRKTAAANADGADDGSKKEPSPLASFTLNDDDD